MSLVDDFKSEVRNALPELKEVVKKELKDQITKRINAGAGAEAKAPIATAQVMGLDPKVVMILGAAVVAFIIFKRR